jgi:hypothetical protein
LSDRCKTNSVQGLQQPYAHCTAQRDWCLTFDHLPILTWDTVLFFKAILRRGLRSGGERWRRSRGVIVVELWQNLCRCGVLLPSQSHVKPPQVHSGTPFINNRFYPELHHKSVWPQHGGRPSHSIQPYLVCTWEEVTTSGTSFRLGILGLCHLSQFLLTGHDGITTQRFFYRQGVPYQTFG